jgi:hypothetical protein
MKNKKTDYTGEKASKYIEKALQYEKPIIPKHLKIVDFYSKFSHKK